MKTMVFWCLAFLLGYGFVRLFYEIGVLNRLAELYRRTRADIDAFPASGRWRTGNSCFS